MSEPTGDDEAAGREFRDFRRLSSFAATLDACRLLGSTFADGTLRPVKVLGGQWRGVTIRGTT